MEKLLEAIRNSKDPEKALEMALLVLFDNLKEETR